MLKVCSAAVLAVLVASPLCAQQTRAELLESRRAEKATKLQPYVPRTLEKFIQQAEEGRLRRLIMPHNGFFVEYGYSHKPTGSGIGFGGGFRHDLFDRRARIVLEAGATFRKYHMLRADFSLPRLLDEHLELGVEAIQERLPQEDFYGLGSRTLEEDRVSFLYEGTQVAGRAILRPRPWIDLGVRVGHLDPSVGSGRDTRFPSIEARFDEAAAPGLLEQPSFGYTDFFAEVDYRDEPGNARAGGHYLLNVRRYGDREFDRYSFTATDLLLQQFFPIFDKKRVFAFQYNLSATGAESGQVVPFYFRPTLGGSRTLRGVSDFRFRDRAATWLNVEYRWEAFGAMDMALFTDWGTVAANVSDLADADLKHAYGIGFRFKMPQVVFFRVDIGTGAGEGTHAYFKFSKAF
jgi:hypothetical protein